MSKCLAEYLTIVLLVLWFIVYCIYMVIIDVKEIISDIDTLADMVLMEVMLTLELAPLMRVTRGVSSGSVENPAMFSTHWDSGLSAGLTSSRRSEMCKQKIK